MPDHKTYPIERSPFYKLENKRRLAALLGVTLSKLSDLCSDSNYEVFQKRVGNKDRLIQHPVGSLERVHRRIQQLLSRIESPSYLFSGKKHVSSLDNAKSHLHNKHFLIVDIEQFFPNCRVEYISSFLRYQMQTSPDVAKLLADIMTYEGHIPTGSPLSMSIAFWAYSKTFDTLNQLAQKKGIRFSLYVDDMTFSLTHPIPPDFHMSVNYHLRRVGLNLKPAKIHYHSAPHFKVITGSALSPDSDLRVPNRIREKIRVKLRGCGTLKTADETVLRSLLGSIVSARQIEPSFFKQTFHRVQNELAARRQEAT